MAGRWAVALLVAVMLGGCSLPNFVYNRADFFVAREVGKYLTLSDAQDSALRLAVTDWQAWHRTHALLQWQADTRTLAAALEAPLTAQQITDWGVRIEGHLRQALDEMMLRLVPLIATLSDEQISEFWASFDEQRAERREEAPDDTDALAKRAAQWMKRWVGRPDDGQAQLIADWAASQAWRWAPAEIDRAMREDARQRAEVDALLAARTAADALQRWRAHLAADPEDNPPEIQAEAGRVELLAALSTTLTQRQRNKLISKVEGYADLFGKMAAGG